MGSAPFFFVCLRNWLRQAVRDLAGALFHVQRTTDFQFVDPSRHRRTGSPSYEFNSTLILSCDQALAAC